jgi:hypothetical protein
MDIDPPEIGTTFQAGHRNHHPLSTTPLSAVPCCSFLLPWPTMFRYGKQTVDRAGSIPVERVEPVNVVKDQLMHEGAV